jgi:hypothetical protein
MLSLMWTGIIFAAEPNHIRIHRFANINNLSVELDRKQAGSTAGNRLSRRTQLKAFGKELTLLLEDNQALLESLPVDTDKPELLRGQLEGNTRSWVRLSRADDGTHGLIWDGTELYVVEPGNSIRSALTIAADLPSSDTVIFRLSDTTVDLGTEYCGSEEPNVSAPPAGTSTGLATYQALTNELSAQAQDSSAATLRLEMLALGDAAFRAQFTSDQAALDAVMVRMNNIDGIFKSQLGLEVHASDVQVYSNDPAQLSASSDAGTLLNALGQLRNSSAVMQTYALTHLFTGRDLDGDTLGIAYIGNICNRRYGVSLSEVRNRGAWIDSLVATHELGHQLGAIHDATGSCATTASGYLMDANINGSAAFSQCSRDSILAKMQAASCLLPITSVNSIAEPTTSTISNDRSTSDSNGGGGITPRWLILLLLGVMRYRHNRPSQ